LIHGLDGRPTHCRKDGGLYRYYVAQQMLKAEPNMDSALSRRVSAAQI
jgi:hypothetical protein